MTDRFQVDLAGMVDLLSMHLYSGPEAYLRELIQNAVDAVSARSDIDPQAPAIVRLSTETDAAGRAVLRVTDTGVGLTATEATELLATIGRSSKRDELGMGRGRYIGQFGIGLLAAFMVAERIEVLSRSANLEAAPIRWIGHADGTFEICELDSGTDGTDQPGQDAAALPVGTTVLLTARPDAEHWLATETVLALAREYGSLLPLDIAVQRPLADSEPVWQRTTTPELPWRVQYPTQEARSLALSAYCEETFGFTPLAQVDLELPLVGVSGVAFILPQSVSPRSGQHRVYTKRMLLGSRIDRVLPEWSFFTRAVLNADTLAPTASREQLRDDEVLWGVRDALGAQLKAWALATLREPTALARAVISTHHLALRALALTDPDMLALVSEVLPFQTSDGTMTLAEVAGRGEIIYAPTTEAYRRVASVARAQGLVLVNAGYVYDADLLEQLGRRNDWNVRELRSSDLVQTLGLPSATREQQVAAALGRAREVLSSDDCDVIARTFAPHTVPAILLRDSEGEHRRDVDRVRNATPDLWDGLLDSLTPKAEQRSRTLVLNDNASVVRRLLTAPAGSAFTAGLRSVYLTATMLAGDGLSSADAKGLADSLCVLLDAALAGPEGGDALPKAGGTP